MIESIPVSILTGFLGSGKSTLLNSLLGGGAMPPTAIVVNEFGEVAIDHALIESVTEGIMLLNSGCVCCAVRSDLEAALRDLHLKRVRDLIPAFEAVILETTGLADPGPVLRTLTSRPVREMRYRLGPVITTLDAVHGEATLKRHHESVRQLAIADRILLTKTDLAPDPEALVALVREINPAAPMVEIARGAALPETVFGGSLLMSRPQDRPIPDGARHHHLSGVSSHGRVIDGLLDWERIDGLINAFLANHGNHILRLKALLRVRGIDGRIALHGLHHSLYPPEIIMAQAGDQRSRVSVIGDGLDKDVAERFLDALAETAA